MLHPANTPTPILPNVLRDEIFNLFLYLLAPASKGAKYCFLLISSFCAWNVLAKHSIAFLYTFRPCLFSSGTRLRQWKTVFALSSDGLASQQYTEEVLKHNIHSPARLL